MNKHTWSALAILVMAILALGSTDNSSSSPTASTIPAPKKIPPANSVAPLESQASQPKSEVDQIFAERMALYEKDLAAWNQLSELRNTLDTQRSDLQTRIKAIESEPPTPPPENEERDWSSIDQKFRTVGVLIQTDYKVATIKKADGKIVTVPKEKFIDEDRRYIENAFVETEVFRKNLAKWNESKSALTVELFTIQNRITAAYNSKPVLPNKQSIENEISAQRLKQEYERRLEKEAEARRMAADEHDQKLKKTWLIR